MKRWFLLPIARGRHCGNNQEFPSGSSWLHGRAFKQVVAVARYFSEKRWLQIYMPQHATSVVPLIDPKARLRVLVWNGSSSPWLRSCSHCPTRWKVTYADADKVFKMILWCSLRPKIPSFKPGTAYNQRNQKAGRCRWKRWLYRRRSIDGVGKCWSKTHRCLHDLKVTTSRGCCYHERTLSKKMSTHLFKIWRILRIRNARYR